MKARVGTTGEIVTLDTRNYVTEVSEGGHPRMWRLAELEFEGDLDYWTRLEHQYAGMAMQGILSNQDYCKLLIDENIQGSFAEDVSRCASEFAHALIQKLKKKEKRK